MSGQEVAGHAVALVGIGKIARDQHIPAIAANPSLTLAATVSRHARVEGVEPFTTIEAMLKARPEIAIVSLATPPQVRFQQAAAAIRAGRHVMLEKPPGATLAECHALTAMARQAGVTLFATWHSRFAAKVETARAIIAGRQVSGVTVTWREDVRRWHPGQDWIFEPGGLGVFDPGINALSILTAILPDPLHLEAAALDFPANRDTPIAAELTFRHPAGVPVAAAFDWRETGQQVWDIAVDTAGGGRVLLSDGGATLAVDGGPAETAADREYPGLYARLVELVEARQSDIDLAPLVHVADAFMLGRRRTVEPFDF